MPELELKTSRASSWSSNKYTIRQVPPPAQGAAPCCLALVLRVLTKTLKTESLLSRAAHLTVPPPTSPGPSLSSGAPHALHWRPCARAPALGAAGARARARPQALRLRRRWRKGLGGELGPRAAHGA